MIEARARNVPLASPTEAQRATALRCKVPEYRVSDRDVRGGIVVFDGDGAPTTGSCRAIGEAYRPVVAYMCDAAEGVE